jgi:hypothetical protein
MIAMKNDVLNGNPDAAIWDRVIQFDSPLSPAAARALLKVRFSTGDADRMHELSAKSRAGSLNSREKMEIDTFEQLGCLLDILHSKARRALRRGRRVGRLHLGCSDAK